MRKGTVVWVEGHTKDLWIEGFNCQVATQGILLEDIQKDAKKVKVCLNTLAGQSNIICDVRLSKLKGYNQEVLTEVYVYGSHLIGGRAKNNILNDFIYKKDIDIIYSGYSLNSSNLSELLDYIKEKRVIVNVISKSGNTMEVNFVFSKVLELMKSKYSEKELRKRIIITTNKNSGKLLGIAKKNNYMKFYIPDISGRYSVMTTAGLLPISVAGVDIDSLIIRM